MPLASTSRAAHLALVTLLLGLAGCGPTDGRPDASATPEARRYVDGSAHLLQLNRLQGMIDGIPCIDDPVPVLAAASELRDELRDDGDQAYLICVGDTLTALKFTSPRKVDVLASEAEQAVAIEALGRVGVDLFVPGALDLAYGASRMLDLAAASDVRVLISNATDLTGRDRCLRVWIPEPSDPDGPRIAFLGAVPTRAATEKGKAQELGDDGLEFDSVVTTVSEEAERVRATEDVDFVVVLSALTQASNSRLMDRDAIDIVLGTTGGQVGVRELAFRSGSVLATASTLGKEVGHTTITIVDDDFALEDVSERHKLVGRIERDLTWLEPFVERYGTDDLEQLERVVRESRGVDGEALGDRIARIAEDVAGLAEMNEYARSRIDHRAAALPAMPPDHPGRTLQGDFAARFAKAVEAEDLRPPTRDLEHPRVPHPDECFSCHKEQYLFWSDTPHRTAFEPVVARDRQHDPSCHECHSTAYGIEGGYDDVRLGAPLGGVSCFACHPGVSTLHGMNARRSLEPLYTWTIRNDQSCGSCHTERRSPDFDQTLMMDMVACPPMDLNAPALVETRLEALEIIEGRFVEGSANDADRFFAARARLAGGIEAAVDEFIGLAEENRDSAIVTVQIARLLDRYGHSSTAQLVLRDYLRTFTGDEGVNTAYVHLLLFPRDTTAVDSEEALRRLRFLLPESGDPSQTEPRFVTLRCYLVDALYMTGRVREGEAELLDLISAQGEDTRIRERVERWNLSKRLQDLGRAAHAEAQERAELGLQVHTTEEGDG